MSGLAKYKIVWLLVGGFILSAAGEMIVRGPLVTRMGMVNGILCFVYGYALFSAGLAYWAVRKGRSPWMAAWTAVNPILALLVVALYRRKDA